MQKKKRSGNTKGDERVALDLKKYRTDVICGLCLFHTSQKKVKVDKKYIWVCTNCKAEVRE